MSGKTLRNVGGLILIVLVAALWLWGQSSHGSDSRGTTTPAASSPSYSPSAKTTPKPSVSKDGWIDASDLPAEARQVLTQIDHGGPFKYQGKDGSTFGNFEGVLPKEPRGYYREYTVDTPGASNRGTRRIITGRGGEFYWTADHYEHFARIRR